ncbi:hypothetical protein LIZ84_11080 [Roseburia faecis]|uniref:hypothetical protein n=1 Tax=Roseburia faecis TaxID=301302 RepID=UPI001D084F6F|nr:hypothetical protein [Roseburia faecis]MCB6948396.1 hypothetical protein [Roseburia faecis]
MKIKMEISKSVFDDHLRDFELADAIYMAAEREFIDFDLDHGTSEEMKAVREKLHSACADREFYAVVLCKYLLSCKDLICFEADLVDALEDSPAADSVDAPEDSPAADPVDASEDSPAADPVDAPEDSPAADLVDAPEDSPATDLVDAPEDIFPVMSAKCKLCPSCVDGRCFFVPDIYDSVFPCQSPAWDDFFKSGGSRSPAPRARASPL